MVNFLASEAPDRCCGYTGATRHVPGVAQDPESRRERYTGVGIREELQPSKSPTRRRRATQSTAYLNQAAEALTDAASPRALWRAADPLHRGGIFEPVQRRVDAGNRRLARLKASVIFSALAAEAYANEFLEATCAAADAAAVDRLATPEKLLLAPRLSGLPSVLERGREPHQTIRRLFRVRNVLVHPTAQGYSALVIHDLTDKDEADLGPVAAGVYLVAVARVIVEMDALRDDLRLNGEAVLLFEESEAVQRFVAAMGTGIGDVPAELAPEPGDLLSVAQERRTRRLGRAPSTTRRDLAEPSSADAGEKAH